MMHGMCQPSLIFGNEPTRLVKVGLKEGPVPVQSVGLEADSFSAYEPVLQCLLPVRLDS